jgi:hypothetical protein
MKNEINKSQENFEKYLMMSINNRNEISNENLLQKKIPLKCSFQNCKKTYGVKSRLAAHLRTHVNILIFPPP